MKPYQEYLDPSLTLGKRPIVWKYTVLIDGEKHRFIHRRDVPAYAGTLTYEADPAAAAEAAVWDEREREFSEAAHSTWKNDLFAQYSSLLTREQFDRVYEILESCSPEGDDDFLTHDEIVEHFEELYGFLFA